MSEERLSTSGGDQAPPITPRLPHSESRVARGAELPLHVLSSHPPPLPRRASHERTRMPPKRASKSPKRTPAKSPADEGLNGGYWGTTSPSRRSGRATPSSSPVVAKAAAKKGKKARAPRPAPSRPARTTIARARAQFSRRAREIFLTAPRPRRARTLQKSAKVSMPLYVTLVAVPLAVAAALCTQPNPNARRPSPHGCRRRAAAAAARRRAAAAPPPPPLHSTRRPPRTSRRRAGRRSQTTPT